MKKLRTFPGVGRGSELLLFRKEDGFVNFGWRAAQQSSTFFPVRGSGMPSSARMIAMRI